MDRRRDKVKHFLKLGYSYSDITRVLQTLQCDAQTNDILEELIKTCRTTTANHMGADSASSSSPQLVPRGCSSPQQHTHVDVPGQQHVALDGHASNRFRPVVIDGSNVAISHGNKQVFSCRGIQLAVQWFWERGIRDITVFVPMWRKEKSRPESPITDQNVLSELERKNILIYTPSRCIKGKRVMCYDDRYIVKLAYDSDGIIVSNDNYRDLQGEKPQWKKFIEERLLMYTFANDMFMPPDDPLGRNGPTIENFLRKKPTGSESKQQPCPYGKKCTYGVKCKFYHPERSNQPHLSVADELRAKSQPESDTKEFAPSSQLTHDYFTNTIPRYANTTSERTQHTRTESAAAASSAYADAEEIDYTPLLDLYNSPQDITGSPSYLERSYPALYKSDQSITGHPNYLQRSLPSLCKSDQSYDSMEDSFSRIYLSDSALQTSLGYSSGRIAGSGNNYFVSSRSHTGHRRAHSPFQGTCSHSSRTYSDPNPCFSRIQYLLRLAMNGDPYLPYLPSFYNEPLLCPGSSAQQTDYTRSPEVSWGQDQARESKGLEQMTDRRYVRSQLSTIFPQNIVDQVMSLNPHTLDTTELIALILKYRNSHLL